MVASDVSEALFVPVAPEHRLHPYFRRLAATASKAELEVFRQWARGLPDRDNKFVHEFQTTFSSSFWEVYVHAALSEIGLQLRFDYQSPDFWAPNTLTVEAVIASNPIDGYPQWAATSPIVPINTESSLDLATIRLAQAVAFKAKKWREKYSKLKHCADLPYVIAVAPYEQPGITAQGTLAISRVLWDEHLAIKGVDEAGEPELLGWAPPPPVYKPSGKRVPLAAFQSPEYEGVSAVFFSSLATWTKVHAMSGPLATQAAYQVVHLVDGERMQVNVHSQETVSESLLDGSHLYLNPNAVHPIDQEPWRKAGVCVHECEGQRIYSNFPARMLVSRWAMSGLHMSLHEFVNAKEQHQFIGGDFKERSAALVAATDFLNAQPPPA